MLTTLGYRNILESEPLQWAVDYLQDILETLEQAGTDSYSMALLALAREELSRLWHKLFSHSPCKGTVFFASGLHGARLFAVRQLLAAMPPVQPCRLHGESTVLRAACSRLVDTWYFLSAFRLQLEEKPPGEEVVKAALRLLFRHNLLKGLSIAGHPLHVYCLDYRLPHPAYYLPPSHTVVCGTSGMDKEEQLRCLLHEFGHVFYTLRGAGQPQAGSPILRKACAENFAHRFASTLLAQPARP